MWELIPKSIGLRAVNGFVARQQEADDGATNKADHCDDPGGLGCTKNWRARAGRPAGVQVCCCAYHGSDTGSHSCPNERVTQAVRVIHEFYPANILPLD